MNIRTNLYYVKECNESLLGRMVCWHHPAKPSWNRFTGFNGICSCMARPYGGPSHAGVGPDGIQLLLWIWATGPMVASSFGLTGDGQLVIIILWAFLLGTIGGFVMPKIIERDRGRRFVDVDVPPDKW